LFNDAGAASWTVNNPTIISKASSGSMYPGIVFNVQGIGGSTLYWYVGADFCFSGP
jgi:hypothetical protein